MDTHIPTLPPHVPQSTSAGTSEVSDAEVIAFVRQHYGRDQEALYKMMTDTLSREQNLLKENKALKDRLAMIGDNEFEPSFPPRSIFVVAASTIDIACKQASYSEAKRLLEKISIYAAQANELEASEEDTGSQAFQNEDEALYYQSIQHLMENLQTPPSWVAELFLDYFKDLVVWAEAAGKQKEKSFSLILDRLKTLKASLTGESEDLWKSVLYTQCIQSLEPERPIFQKLQSLFS